MTQLIKVVRAQLQLPLEPVAVFPSPLQQVRREVVEALADLLLEAVGAEESEPQPQKEATNEREDHV